MNDPDRLLDAKLRAAFNPPPAAAFAAQARALAHVRRPLWPWLMAAAAALLTVAFAISWPSGRPAGPDGPEGPNGHTGEQLGALWAAAYEHALAIGVDESFCCDPAQDFGRACERLFDVRVALGDGEGDVRLAGCYCGLPIGGCVAAVAQTSRGLVGVFALPRGQDCKPQLPADRSLHLTRRELGPLVLYAVSAAPTPQTLERFVVQP